MALSGSLNIVNYELSGNIITSSFTVPMDVHPSSSYYDQRGQTVEEYVSESVAVSSSYNNAYVKIKANNIWINTEEGTDTGSMNLESTYRIYGSKASRSADLNNHLLESAINITWDPDLDSNVFSKSYSQIKNELGADTLTDV